MLVEQKLNQQKKRNSLLCETLEGAPAAITRLFALAHRKND
jgi:hypothetical protein